MTADRLQSVLIYLLLHRDRQVPRQYLAFQFWPDLSEAQARNNLRQLLHQLRHALPESDQYLEINAKSVAWRNTSPFQLDLAAYEEALVMAGVAEANNDLALQKNALEKAVHLYQGDIVPACYEEWILPERERLQQSCQVALEQLAHLLEQERFYARAIPYVQRLLLMNPVAENGYRLLMRLYALNDDRAAALHTYRTCFEKLEKELGVEPEQVTQELYQRLMENPNQIAGEKQRTDHSRLPLIGRNTVWAQLISLWHQAEMMGLQFVMITGEAGIGKTRLAEELLAWVDRQGISTARTWAYAAEGQLSYDPVVTLLKSPAIASAIKKIEPTWQAEISRVLPELAIEHPNLPQVEPMQSQWQRQRLFQALTRAIMSARLPLLLLIDDLQWCDLETLEWLHYLIRSTWQSPILILSTIRLEEAKDENLQSFLLNLQQSIQVTEISLDPLDAAETAHLAASASQQRISVEIALRLFNETEGNPLFILEMLHSGLLSQSYGSHEPLDSLDGHPRQSTLPPKVSAVIKARLAQLSPTAGELVRLAAVIGRAFSYQLLKDASDIDERMLARALDELLHRRIIRDQGNNVYDFSHDKLREVAYDQIGHTLKRLVHQNIAIALESNYTGRVEQVHSQIAAHYEQAGRFAEAIPHYHQAAQMSQRVGASREAVRFLEKALVLLKTFPKTAERDAKELDIQTTLGICLVNSLGHGAPQVMEVFQQAHALSTQLGLPETPSMLRALGLTYISHARYHQGQKYGEQLRRLGENQGNQVLQVEGNYMIGVSRFWLGDFLQAQDFLRRAITLYQPELSQVHITLFSQDPQVICLSRLAFTLWCLGYVDDALATSEKALAYAQNQAHPFSLGYAMFWDLLLLNHTRFFKIAEQRDLKMIAYCKEKELAFWLPQAEAMFGWIKAEQGMVGEGMQLLRKGIEAYQAMGAKMHQPFYFSLLAELLSRDSTPGRQNPVDSTSASDYITKAFSCLKENDERWCEAEVYRRRGEVLVKAENEQAAEQAFETAQNIAGSQKAKTMELRASLGLARLWQKQGKAGRVKNLLESSCRWFDQKSSFPDLEEARSLLAMP